MIVATLKDHILQEESVEGYKIRVMRLDSSDEVELEIKDDKGLVVRKKMENLEKAKQFVRKLRNKFKNKRGNKKFNLNEKKARINSDDPKAFQSGSPSENPFASEGPGGLLQHMQLMRKKKKPYNKKRKKRRTRKREKWDDTSGRENDYFQLSRWGPESGPSRDSGPDRDGFDQALEKGRNEGRRPALPKGEDSIDLMKNPKEYKPMYDSGYPGDRETEQDLVDKQRHREHKRHIERAREVSNEDRYVLLFIDRGKRNKITGLTFQEAAEKAKHFPGARIVKQK